jgi:hypothetical protein
MSGVIIDGLLIVMLDLKLMSGVIIDGLLILGYIKDLT